MGPTRLAGCYLLLLSHLHLRAARFIGVTDRVAPSTLWYGDQLAMRVPEPFRR